MKRWEIGIWTVGEPEICSFLPDKYVWAETKDEALDQAVQLTRCRRELVEVKEFPELRVVVGTRVVKD